MVRHSCIASDPVFKRRHEGDRVAPERYYPRTKFDDIQPPVAPFALADVGLQLSKRLGELHLRHTCRRPRPS